MHRVGHEKGIATEILVTQPGCRPGRACYVGGLDSKRTQHKQSTLGSISGHSQ
jgi:hypothetical protein